MSADSAGRMTVQLYERDTETFESTERGEAQTSVLAVVISYGDDLIEVSLDTDDGRQNWEIEVIGQATVYHR